MRAAALLAVGLVACGRQSQAVPRPDASSADSPKPPPSVPQSGTFSTAYFAGGILETCSDLTILAPPTAKPGWVEEIRGVALARDGGASVEHLRKSCTEQFADHPSIATCSSPVTAWDGGGGGSSSVIHYYTVSKLHDDAEMRSCLRHGDDWQAVPHDSPEYLEAKQADLQRRIDKMGGSP